MIEQEMKSRMREIDRERDKLRKEKEEYESYFHNKKKEEALNNHRAFVGKCFVTKDLRDNKKKHIKAFKIIGLDSQSERYAECVALLDKTIEKDCGIQIMKLGLWTPNQFKLMNKPDDPKIIDYYREISQEEFNVLYRSYLQKLNDKAY